MFGNFLERADDVSMSTAGSVVTAQATPGDKVVVRLQTMAGRRSWLREVRAVVVAGDAPVPTVLPTVRKYLDDETNLIELDVPRELPLGRARIVLDLDEQVEIETGRMLSTVYVSSYPRANRLELPLDLRSATERDAARMRARIKAATAWLAAMLAMYALARWSFPRVRLDDDTPESGLAGKLVLMLVVGVATALAVVSRTVFVVPLEGTLVPLSSAMSIGVAVAWCLALALGMWAGFSARKPLPSWLPVTIRAVVGSPRETGYRTAASTLPATLSREAPRCDRKQLIAVLQEAGLEVEARGRNLHIACDGEQVLRIRTRRPAPWVPEELEVQAREDINPEPIIRELAKVYGPMELRNAAHLRTMVE